MEALKRSRDFSRVIDGGRRKYLETIVAYRLPNQEGKTRVGISVTRRTGGGSVQRNRIKRRIREAIRKNASLLPVGEDMVFVARRGIETAAYQDIEGDIITALGGNPGEKDNR
ncbi:MAG: ribonuclease P protein component [Actinomycetota bacterium]